MSHINFKPWVGDNYATTGFRGMRILVLGESHYCRKELANNGRCYPICSKEKMREVCFNQTINVLDDIVYYLNRSERYHQTFIHFENAIFGRDLRNEQNVREAFWNSVIFYNYFQYAQTRATMPLEQASYSYEESAKAFQEVLEEYMPDYIIVWGCRLYSVLPHLNGEESKLSIENGDTTQIWTYQIKGKKIPAMKIKHPCMGKGASWPYMHQFHKKFLNLPDSI